MRDGSRGGSFDDDGYRTFEGVWREYADYAGVFVVAAVRAHQCLVQNAQLASDNDAEDGGGQARGMPEILADNSQYAPAASALERDSSTEWLGDGSEMCSAMVLALILRKE